MNKYRTHTCGDITLDHKDKQISISGWINKKRDHGNLLFIDLRDHYGITQCVIENTSKNFKVLQLSLLTGFFIGLYSLVDGYGARVSLSPIVYMSWAFILSAILFPIVLKIKNHKNIFQNVFNSGKQIFWIGGTLSYIIYTIVVWAFTKAPIPMVGALRESSIFFSIFIGYFFLKEKITPTKIISIVLILAGVVGLKLF